MKVVSLISGGIDSVTAMYFASKKYDLTCGLSFDYGSKHNHLEIPFAKYHCDKLNIPHKVISLNFIKDLFESSLLQDGPKIPKGLYDNNNMKKTVVPFRNGIFLSIASGFAESKNYDAIIIGAHSGDHDIYPDCREDFFKNMSKSIQSGTYKNLEILRPFVLMPKHKIVSIADEMNINLSKTWSCYEGQEIHCGECSTCLERKESFKISKIKDPTTYKN